MESKHIASVLAVAIVSIFVTTGHGCQQYNETIRTAIEHGLQECAKIGGQATIWTKECK